MKLLTPTVKQLGSLSTANFRGVTRDSLTSKNLMVLLPERTRKIEPQPTSPPIVEAKQSATPRTK